MKKSLLTLIILYTSIIYTSDFTIPVINKTTYPVVVTIVSHSEEISSIEVAPTIKKVQQFCSGLTFSSIKYIVMERPTEKLPQIVRFPYTYEAQKICTKCHTQHNAVTSWCDVIGTALNENYRSGKSVSSTTEEILQNNIIVNKKDISMAINGIFKSINYEKIIADVEKSLSADIKKINKSVETISMILEDFNIMDKLKISNLLIKKLEMKALELSKTLFSLSPLLASLHEDIMNIDMMTSIIKKKNYDQDDLVAWNKSLANIMKNLQIAKALPIATIRSVAQEIKHLESKYDKIISQIDKLSVIV